MARAPKSISEESSDMLRLIEAAVRCIEKYGVDKTYIDDIAREAGLSRSTAYRICRSRQEILERVAQSRISAMEITLREKIGKYRSLGDALVHGTVDTVRLARQDQVFMSTLQAAGYQGFERVLLDPRSHVIEQLQNVWGELIAKARVKGEIRQQLSDSDVFEFMRAMQFILISKEDMTEKKQADFLRKFMVPALTAG